MIRWAVSLPERLIRNRVNKPKIRLEVVAVFVLGILGSAGLIYFANDMWSSMAERLRPTYLSYSLIGTALEPLIIMVGAWVWYTISAHFIAKLYNGRGPIGRLFRTAAWSLVPIGIWLIIRSIVIFAIFWQEDLPSEPDEEGLLLPREFVTHYLELGLDTPLYVVLLLSSVLFVAWSWYLFSIGIEEAKKVSTEKARRIAAIPAGVLAIYFIREALRWQGIL